MAAPPSDQTDPAPPARAPLFHTDTRNPVLVGAFCIMVLVTTTYHSVGSFGAVWDDNGYVLGNAALADLQSLRHSLFTDANNGANPGAVVSNLFRPATFVSYFINAALLGPTAASFHLGNLLLHVLASVLLFAFLLGRMSPGRPGVYAAWLASVVWALHPEQVEAVAWISGRYDLLGTCLSVAALLLQGRTTRLAAVARAALLVLATLSKESFAVMFVVLLVDDWVAGRASRTRVATLAAGAGGWGFLRAQAHLASLGPFLSGRPPGALLADYLSAVGVYSSRALDPFPLSLDHPYQPLTPLALLGVAAAMAAVAALCWRSPRLAAPATLFLLGMAPIGLMLEQTGTSAERYFLGPSVGLAWALGLGIDTYFRGEPFRSHSRVLVGSLAAVVACAAGACQRLPDWQSEETIYAAAERVDPGGWFGAFHLGVVQVDQRRDPSAFPLLQRALQAALARGAPAHHTAQILNTLAGVHLRRGDPEQALKAATLALAVTPNSPAFHLQTAECFAAKGLGFEALTHLDAALSLSPSLDRARALRALLRAQTGNAAGAWADLNELRTRGASASNIEPEASDARAFLIGLH